MSACNLFMFICVCVCSVDNTCYFQILYTFDLYTNVYLHHLTYEANSILNMFGPLYVPLFMTFHMIAYKLNFFLHSLLLLFVFVCFAFSVSFHSNDFSCFLTTFSTRLKERISLNNSILCYGLFVNINMKNQFRPKHKVFLLYLLN